jgi:signal transduction histidine kinase
MPAETSPATVLVVDDDQGLLRLIQRALEREGFSVLTADSGEQAIKRLSEQRPNLMLLDLKLQDVEGRELINELAATQRLVPFIVITGQGDERVAVEMMKRGALDYLVKDAQFLQFVPQIVQRALEQLDKDRRLAQLQKQVLEISEREQRRIGQDLHDGLGQQLTAIELMCQTIKNDPAVAKDKRRLKKELDRLSGYIRSAITQTRSLAHGLTPFKVESGGLEIALADLAESTSASSGIRCRFRCASPIVVADQKTATHLYRIAQEAVSNTLRHSGARLIEISLRCEDKVLSLEVSDDGKGFGGKPGSGMGLGMMNHRAEVIGAKLDVKSARGKGTTVTCRLPVQN